jgi:putative solute:sodium symporter small subunit
VHRTIGASGEPPKKCWTGGAPAWYTSSLKGLQLTRGDIVRQLSPADRAEHWRQTRRLMIVHLSVWFIFAYVVHWFALPLNQINFFGWPLGYYMSAQGSLIVFVVQLFLFSRQQHAIDVKFGVEEQE